MTVHSEEMKRQTAGAALASELVQHSVGLNPWPQSPTSQKAWAPEMVYLEEDGTDRARCGEPQRLALMQPGDPKAPGSCNASSEPPVTPHPHSPSSARQTGSHTCLTGLLRPPAHSQLLHHTCPLPALAPACPLPAPAPACPQPVPAPTCPQPAPVPACPPVLTHFYPTGSRSSTTFSTRPPILLADQPHL